METVVKVGRTIGGGVYRAAGVVVRGARRILAAIPLLGLSADDPADESSSNNVTMGGEEAETATSPTEDKSAIASPTESSGPPATEAKEDDKASTPVTSPEEKKEAPSSPIAVPVTPVPVEAMKEEIVKEVEKTVEVSQVEALDSALVEVKTKSQPIITSSIIERKTSEDFPSLLPSSPPPTPIDPSPLQQAQQSAANASALAEALKLPAENNSYKNNQLENSQNDDLPTATINNVTIELSRSEEKFTEQIEIKELITTEFDIEKKLPLEESEIIIETEEGAIPVPCVILEPEDLSESNNPETETIETMIIDDIKDDNEQVLSEESLPVTVEHDNDAATEIAITEIPEDESLSTDKTEIEEEIPPPLPESPIPMPKASTDLLNFMTSQIDTPNLPEINDIIPNTINTVVELAETLIVPVPIPDVVLEEPEEKINEPVKSMNDFEIEEPNDLPLPPPDVPELEEINKTISSVPKSLLTPPRSPSPPSSSSVKLEINGHNGEQNVVNGDPIKENVNLQSDHSMIDRLAEEITSVKCNNVQSIAEPEAPVENNVAVTDNSTTETIEEPPKCQLPTVPAEAPVTAPVAPAITEDVASVTKAIEEIDINEKAMAMAVNENIESMNTNEIIADMNHHNQLNE